MTDFEKFRHRCGDDFTRSGNVKNKEKLRRVALFLIFRVCKTRCHYEAVWGVLGRVWVIFWSILSGFRGFENREKFEKIHGKCTLKPAG